MQISKIVLCILLFSLKITAQNYDHKWLLASSFDGIKDDQCIEWDFSVNPPTLKFRITPIYFEDNSVTISDSSGAILFYTNGCDYLDDNNQTFIDHETLDLDYVQGYCFNGNPVPQNVIILPFKEQNKFYSIYKNVVIVKPIFDIVSTKLMYGNIYIKDKDITSKNFNTLIVNDTMTQGYLSATKHNNLADWWVVVSKAKTNKYQSILIKSDSVYSPIETILGDTINQLGEGVGQSVFSPDGTKYAFTNVYQGVFLFDFDRISGKLSNYKRIQLPVSDTTVTFGCAFSSNGRFLYVCGLTILYQIDTWVLNPETALDTVAFFTPFLDQCGPFPNNYYKAQLAPDCRIYISSTNGTSCLNVINNPNQKGVACNVLNGGLSFPKEIYNIETLPNYPNYNLGFGEVCDSSLLFPIITGIPTVKIKNNNIIVYPNPSSDLINLIIPIDLKVPNEIFIYSISGLMVDKALLKHIGQENLISINIITLSKGMYFLNWVDNETGKTYFIKFIKE